MVLSEIVFKLPARYIPSHAMVLSMIVLLLPEIRTLSLGVSMILFLKVLWLESILTPSPKRALL
jgi:hypothetical protein